MSLMLYNTSLPHVTSTEDHLVGWPAMFMDWRSEQSLG